MNANIFSCTVPPLLVLETQIIHPELLQSLCINPCIPLGSIFLADVCAQTGAGGRRRVRARVDVCVCTHPSARVLTRLRPHAYVYACRHPSAPLRTRLRMLSPICMRPHPSAPARTRLHAPSASVDLGLTRQLY